MPTPDRPVFPQHYVEWKGNKWELKTSDPGISTRAILAGFAMCGLLSRGEISGEKLTGNALAAADRLLEKL